MKKGILCFALILFISMNAWTAEVSFVRIKMPDRESLIPLIQKEVSFFDVKVHKSRWNSEDRYHLKWFPENGYVTARGSHSLAAELAAMGYDILKVGTVTRIPDKTPEGRNLPYQFGWPKTMSGWPGVYGQATTIGDASGNGDPEIFLNTIEGYVYGWRYNGTFVPSYPRNPYQRFVGIDPQTGDSVFASWASTGSRETGALGDIDGDGQGEFIFGKDIGYLFAFPYGPGMTTGFPIDLGLAYFSNDPALYDIDNDNQDEIIIVSYLWPTGTATYGPAQVHIFNEDGSEHPGWPLQLPVNSESSPVVGDIDGDSEVEIVVGSGEDPNNNIPGRLYAWNADGSPCSGFPIEVGNSVNSTPSLADIDQDGIPDILIRINLRSTGVNGVYAFDGQGQIIKNFPAVINRGGTVGAPAVADMEGDGLPDIAIGVALAVDSGMVYVFNNDASLKSGFPAMVQRTWVEESVALADVSGDSLPDVVATTNGTTSKPGMVWAFDYQGNAVSGFPITTANVVGSSLESAPSVVDVDGDGDTELFTANWNGKVFAWDTPGIPVPDNQWPMYKYSAWRTGGRTPATTGIAGDRPITAGQFALFPNYPNPFNPQTTIRYQLPNRGEVRLEIYNIRGQKVATLIDGIKPAGQHRAVWDGTDNNGRQVASGLYVYRLTAGDYVQSRSVAPLWRKMLLMK